MDVSPGFSDFFDNVAEVENLTNNKNKQSAKEMLMARVDIQSMEEIEGHSKSDNVEDRIKALTIFENEYSRLPMKRAWDFIGKMKNSENEKVKQKAGDVYEKTVKVDMEKFSDSMRNFTEAYKNSFQNLVPRLNDISNSFLISKQFAEQLNKSLEIPIKSINKSIIAEYIKPRETISETLGKQLTTIRYSSPILTASFYATPLLEMKEAEETLEQILKKDPEDIKDDLEKVIAAEEDIVFNYEGYRILCDLERLLRWLIQKKIIEPYSDIIGNKIPPKILTEWERRKREEENNVLVDSSHELIDYSDFTHLKIIFEKGRNLNEFSDVANGEELKGLISKLHELDPIRKKIAHSRSLSKREFDKLKIYAEDIIRIFP